MKNRLYNFYKSYTAYGSHNSWLSGGEYIAPKNSIYSNLKDYYVLDNLCDNNLCKGTGTNYAYYDRGDDPDGLYIANHIKYQTRLFKKLTDLELSSLYFPKVCGIRGTEVEDSVIPPIAYRLGYYMWQIKQLCSSSEKNVILEIGGGWGALANLILNNIPNSKYIIVDIPSSIVGSAYFLHQCGKKIVLPGEYEDLTFSQLTDEFDCVFVMPEDVKLIEKDLCDVACSTACLPELPPETIIYYYNEIVRMNLKYLYLDFTLAAHGHTVGVEGDKLESRGYEKIMHQETPINTYMPWYSEGYLIEWGDKVLESCPEYIQERIYKKA